MPVADDVRVRRYEHGDLSLDRVSHQREAGEPGRRFQRLYAAVRQRGLVQTRDRRDSIRAAVLRSHLLYRLVPLRLAGKISDVSYPRPAPVVEGVFVFFFFALLANEQRSVPIAST